MDDAERITRALRNRGATMRCPSCQFALRGPLGGYRLLPDEDEPPPAAERRGIKVMVYACGNCGYVRLHSAGVITGAVE